MAMKPIVLSEKSWTELRQHLIETQPKSVMLSREKMRRELGFTDRKHISWVKKVNKWGGMGQQHTVIHLDFFDESKRTYFLLKYADFFSRKHSSY